jgi:hypothetical protein
MPFRRAPSCATGPRLGFRVRRGPILPGRPAGLKATLKATESPPPRPRLPLRLLLSTIPRPAVAGATLPRTSGAASEAGARLGGSIRRPLPPRHTHHRNLDRSPLISQNRPNRPNRPRSVVLELGNGLLTAALLGRFSMPGSQNRPSFPTHLDPGTAATGHRDRIGPAAHMAGVLALLVRPLVLLQVQRVLGGGDLGLAGPGRRRGRTTPGAERSGGGRGRTGRPVQVSRRRLLRRPSA